MSLIRTALDTANTMIAALVEENKLLRKERNELLNLATDVVSNFEWYEVDPYDREYPSDALHDLKKHLKKLREDL